MKAVIIAAVIGAGVGSGAALAIRQADVREHRATYRAIVRLMMDRPDPADVPPPRRRDLTLVRETR